MRVFPALMPDVASFGFSWYQTRPSMLDEAESLVKPEYLRLTAGPENRVPNQPPRRIGWLDVELKPFSEQAFQQVIDLAVRHRPTQQGFSLPSASLASGEFLRSGMPSGLPDAVLALTSRCRFSDGRAMQLPMLDFRCEPEDYFLALLRVGLKRIVEGGGAIVRSGRSFHFYGFKPLDEAAWRKFMTQALLLAPLTDVRYVAHRLLDGFAALRLTTSKLKPTAPTIAAYLDA